MRSPPLSPLLLLLLRLLHWSCTRTRARIHTGTVHAAIDFRLSLSLSRARACSQRTKEASSELPKTAAGLPAHMRRDIRAACQIVPPTRSCQQFNCVRCPEEVFWR